MSQGKIEDLRDKSHCPSFSNLKNRDTFELASMLVEALEGQIGKLESLPNHDEGLLRELRQYLEKVKKAYSKILHPQQPAASAEPSK